MGNYVFRFSGDVHTSHMFPAGQSIILANVSLFGTAVYAEDTSDELEAPTICYHNLPEVEERNFIPMPVPTSDLIGPKAFFKHRPTYLGGPSLGLRSLFRNTEFNEKGVLHRGPCVAIKRTKHTYYKRFSCTADASTFVSDNASLPRQALLNMGFAEYNYGDTYTVVVLLRFSSERTAVCKLILNEDADVLGQLQGYIRKRKTKDKKLAPVDTVFISAVDYPDTPYFVMRYKDSTLISITKQ